MKDELVVQRHRDGRLRLVVEHAVCVYCGLDTGLGVVRGKGTSRSVDDGWGLLTFRAGCIECDGPLGQVWLTAREEALMQYEREEARAKGAA